MSDQWTLAQVFAQRVSEHASRTLLMAGGRAVTYEQVDARASALAAGLAELGVESGDRVAINLPNCAEWVIALLACAKLGAVVVPVNPRLGYHELKYLLRHAEVSTAFTTERFDGVDYLQIFEDLIAELPDLQYLVTVGKEELWYDDRIFQFEDLVSSGAGRTFRSPAGLGDGSDLALLYGVGPEGKPRGARLSHRAVVETAVRAGEAVEVEPSDRVLASVPLFTIFGFSVAVGTIAAGATLVLQEEFRAAEAVRRIEEDRVSVIHGVPTTYHLLMREPGFDPARFHHLRTGVIAGGPVAAELVRRVRRWCDVQIAYGLPEAATVSVTRFTDSEDKRLETVGRPLPGVEVRVLDADTGRPAPMTAVGEVSVRGPNVMSGYVRMPGETARVVSADGFVRTGDLGTVDAEGYLRIVGRGGEAILRSGWRIVPREVEDQLRVHPAVRDVRVIGIPHEVLGELVCACVAPVEGALVTGEELKDFTRDTMADYKVPDMVRFFDSLPGQSGEGDRAARRELERTVALETTSPGL